MPFHCLVPKCRGNYDKNLKVSTFKFPDDPELRKIWIHAIKRVGCTPSDSLKAQSLRVKEMDIYEQQGGDITASDMVAPELHSEIEEFYRQSTVFITGATGFLGKLCLEKLLRICPDINKVYILIRPKKDKDAKKRFEEIFEEPAFDVIKRKNPSFREKVFAITGDCALPELGLNEDDRNKLIEEVDVVFHFAATVRFDEKIRLATHINVRGVRDALRLARQMKKLRSFLHVSTAFSNCNREEIEEKIYDPPISGEKLLSLVECLEDDKLEAITPTILGDFPNTYCLTKCVAEDVVRHEGKNLPVAIYRPSIVIATKSEPVAGWIDNLYGATGVLVGVAVGLLRMLNADPDKKADLVPADYVINSCLASAWDIATIKTLNDNKETQDEASREEKFDSEIPVYNYVSTTDNPLTWRDFDRLSHKYCKQIPSEKVIWHHFFFMVPNKTLATMLTFLMHTVPAYIVDFIAVCIGKKPMLVKGYQKINKFGSVLSFFTLTQWKWKNDNVWALWDRMKKDDRELFDFDIKTMSWERYFHTYSRGARVYLLKDPLDTIPQGAVKYNKLMVAHYTLLAVIGFLFYKLSVFLFRCIFMF